MRGGSDHTIVKRRADIEAAMVAGRAGEGDTEQFTGSPWLGYGPSARASRTSPFNTGDTSWSVNERWTRGFACADR